ncbi:MAG: PKD domain-containing protein [Flavobacterium sp.]|nr:PKD domain-containing protein [Flavobacterium sp.]
MLKNYPKYLLFVMLFAFLSCLKEEILIANADFIFEETITSTGKKLTFTNLSTNGEQFEWTFENGTPATSTEFNPGQVSFTVAGTQTIKLKVSNKDGSVSEIEKQIEVTSNPTTDFSYQILINNYAPVEVQLTNLSQNIASYDWQFSNGSPSNSTQAQPSNVLFNTVGTQTITLNTLSTSGITSQKTITFEVLPELNTNFDYSVLPIDDNFNAPVKVFIENSTISATSYTWEVVGASPSNSTLENPSFIFNAAGNYQIKLTATNGKQTQTLIKNITVLPYANLSTQTNVKLGINSAQNTVGSYYSTTQKKVYKSSEINAQNGSGIDIVFFGLGNTFTSNVFVSPTEAATFGLTNIPNATVTQYTNKQENCSCSIVTETDFDNITDDTFLQGITITAQNSAFNNTVVPRIIPFVTANGRKGVVKLKSFVTDGANSYVLVDIKVQKSL